MKALFRFAILAATAFGAACTVHGTDVPELTGPTEFGQSVQMTATPDSISQDGASQSAIAVVVRGPDGTPTPGVSIRLQTELNGSVQDYGTLSARTVVTNNDGRATAIYTAPPPPPSIGGSGNVVTVVAEPIGSNYQASVQHTVDVRLVPPGVVLPPASAPTARFAVSPTPVSANILVNFDASTSCATQAACSSAAGISSFSWNFGDGTSGVGQTTTHAFAAGGTYSVTLTVTNDRGLSASTSQTISVGTSAAPTAAFVFSPTPAVANTPIYFNADQSKAANGRRIVQYSWNFGDGSVGQVGDSLFIVSHTFTTTGKFSVVLSVVDDAGQKATSVIVVDVQ